MQQPHPLIHPYKASFCSKGEPERERERRKTLVCITPWVKGIGFSYAFQFHTLFKTYDFKTYTDFEIHSYGV